MHRILTLVVINHHLPFILFLFNIFKHVGIVSFCVHYNPDLNIFQLRVFEVLVFHENTELLPPGDSYELSPGKYYPTDGTIFFIVGVSIINQLVWVELANEY